MTSRLLFDLNATHRLVQSQRARSLWRSVSCTLWALETEIRRESARREAQSRFSLTVKSGHFTFRNAAEFKKKLSRRLLSDFSHIKKPPSASLLRAHCWKGEPFCGDGVARTSTRLHTRAPAHTSVHVYYLPRCLSRFLTDNLTDKVKFFCFF